MKWNVLNKIINSNDVFLLSTHVNPDGDGLGSEIAFYYYLKSLGKQCKIINCSLLPKHYKFIDPDNIIEHYDETNHSEWIKNVDVSIAFDIGDCKRLNELYDEINNNNIYSVCIDHHPSESNFFDAMFIDISMPATGYMVWNYLMYNKFTKLPLNAANGLYCALITDTGSFRYNSTTPECHEMAAHLLNLGVKPYDIYANVYERREVPQIILLSLAINKIKFFEDGEFAMYTITQEMLKSANAKANDVEGFTDFVRSIKGVEVAFMILEQKFDYRLNFRSRGKYIINDIAEKFGGGGHKLAAGATVKNYTIDKIESTIINLLNKKKRNYVNKI